MRIVCSGGIEDTGSDPLDVLVLPERTTREEIALATARWPKAVVVGATGEGKHIRAHMVRGGEEHIDYLKVLSDQISEGTGVVPERPTYDYGHVAIGVLVCRDFQHADLRQLVADQLASAEARLKLICIPGDMDSEWFPGNTCGLFSGAYVAMSNNRRTPSHARRRSFIAGPDGVFLCEQSALEAVSFNAP